MNQLGKAKCQRCGGTQWVCENHRDKPWPGLLPETACGCHGAGDPCPDCNPLAAMSEEAARRSEVMRHG